MRLLQFVCGKWEFQISVGIGQFKIGNENFGYNFFLSLKEYALELTKFTQKSISLITLLYSLQTQVLVLPAVYRLRSIYSNRCTAGSVAAEVDCLTSQVE